MKTKKRPIRSKSKPAPHVWHTINSLSGALGVPVAIIRQAKKAGATGFRANGNVDLISLAKWLLTKGQAFMPQMDLESARATLAQARAGQIIREGQIAAETMAPIEQQARTLQFAVYLWTISLPGVADELASKIAPDGRTNISAALLGALRDSVVTTVAAACAPIAGLPAWAVEALRQGAEFQLRDDGGKDFKARVEFLQQFLSVRAGVNFEQQLEHVLQEKLNSSVEGQLRRIDQRAQAEK